MGFLKDLGTGLGAGLGTVLGGAVSMVGDALESDFIREVGEGVDHASRATGDLLGDLAEGTSEAIAGALNEDRQRVTAGFDQLGGAAERTARGVGATVSGLAENGGKAVDGFLNDDTDRALEGLRGLAKTVAVATIAVGITDLVVDFDVDVDSDPAVDAAPSSTLVAEVPDPPTPEGIHHVDPHWVSGYETADGGHVEGFWRDGDGDTSENLSKADGGGYLRSNPDGDPTNNLG